MSKTLRRIKLRVLLWMANRCNAVSSWCYYHAFTTKEERKRC